MRVTKGLGWPVLVGLLIGFFVVAFVRTAWVADDAYITFRVIANFSDGLGLVWNPGERVQVYTHPLWLFALIPFGLLGADPYWSSLALSLVLLLLIVSCLLRAAGRNLIGLVIASLLLFSKSFIDYSSSGLENPLSHFLLALYFCVLLGWEGRRRLLYSGFLAGLIFLNRPDMLIILVPTLSLELYGCLQRRDLKGAVELLFSIASIMIGWIAFSLFYYGTPVPNTALAKVGAGISGAEAASNGWAGIKWLLSNDSVSVALILSGIVLGLIGRNIRLMAVSTGVILWVGYFLYVGGDFMGGRFFSSAVLVSVIILLREVTSFSPPVKTMVLPVLLCANAAGTTVLSSPYYHNPVISSDGIADERGFYYQSTGLVPNLLMPGLRYQHPWYLNGLKLRLDKEGITVGCTVGLSGYAAGSEAYIVDPFALTDPFLARLPSRKETRVGHYERGFPEGYLESRIDDSNVLRDPALARMYELVRVATQGKLWSFERMSAVIELNLNYKGLVAASDYDSNRVGLPGREVVARGRFSCVGELRSVWLWSVAHSEDGLKAMPVDEL